MSFDTYIEKILADIENLNFDHIAPWEIVNARKELATFREAAQHGAHPTGCTCPRFEKGSKVFPMRECDGCREPASG